MDVDAEERKLQLSKLEKFIEMSRGKLESIATSVGWSMDRLEAEEEEIVACPLDSGHRMPASRIEKHIEKCTLRREGYNSDDEFLSSSALSSSPAVLIDKDTQAQILQDAAVLNGSEVKAVPNHIPRTLNRYLVELSATERSALHDFALSKTRRKDESSVAVEDLQLPFSEDKKSHTKSKLELLAEQRDAKRRRVNYKKVHTGRKSHTEVLHELIENQMEHLKSRDRNVPNTEKLEETHSSPC